MTDASPRPCRLCGEPITFVTTEANGKPMPLDVEPTLAGHVVLIDGQDGDSLARVLNDEEREYAIEFGLTLFRSHFASCSKSPRRST